MALSEALRVQGPELGLQLPIRAVVAGGAVAVLKFGGRTITQDVDFALDANQVDLEDAIQRIADGITLYNTTGRSKASSSTGSIPL